ncbi:WGR domain protein [Pelomyxa schiedti]|nr:WGR domain protein [Pelomyxa schiedti]
MPRPKRVAPKAAEKRKKKDSVVEEEKSEEEEEKSESENEKSEDGSEGEGGSDSEGSPKPKKKTPPAKKILGGKIVPAQAKVPKMTTAKVIPKPVITSSATGSSASTTSTSAAAAATTTPSAAPKVSESAAPKSKSGKVAPKRVAKKVAKDSEDSGSEEGEDEGGEKPAEAEMTEESTAKTGAAASKTPTLPTVPTALPLSVDVAPKEPLNIAQGKEGELSPQETEKDSSEPDKSSKQTTEMESGGESGDGGSDDEGDGSEDDEPLLAKYGKGCTRESRTLMLSEQDWATFECQTNTVIAVRAPEPGLYYVAKLKEPLKQDSDKIKVMWFEKDEGDGVYVKGTDDEINAGAFIRPIKLQKHVCKLPRSKKVKVYFTLPPSERHLIQQILFADMEKDDTKDSKKRQKAPKKQSVSSDVSEPGSEPESDDGSSNDDDILSVVEPKKKPAIRKKRATRVSVAKKPKAPKKPRAPRAPRKRQPASDLTKPSRKRRAVGTTKPRKNAPTPRPDMKVINENWYFDRKECKIDTSCCVFCTGREVSRSIITNDIPLLKSCVENKNVFSLDEKRSADVDLTPLHYAVLQGNLEALNLLLDRSKERTIDRVSRPPCNLVVQKTGSYSIYTYGHAVRKLTCSRKGKEGNNAFACDLDDYDDEETTGEFVAWVLQTPGISKEVIEVLLVKHSEFAEYLPNNIVYAIEAGNRELAAFLIEKMQSRGGWGFNELHKNVLAYNNEELVVPRIPSITKKPIENHAVTPLHCAAINPNPKYIRTLKTALPAGNVVDNRGRKLIHYAAGCDGTGPLEYLLSHDANCLETDNAKITALMLAARYGREKNVELLIKAQKELREKIEKENLAAQADVLLPPVPGSESLPAILPVPGMETPSTAAASLALPLLTPPSFPTSLTPQTLLTAPALPSLSFPTSLTLPTAASAPTLLTPASIVPPTFPSIMMPASQVEADGDLSDGNMEDSDGEGKPKPKKALGRGAKKLPVTKRKPMANSLDLRDRGGNTALHHAAIGNHPTVIKLLLEAGAKAQVLNSNKQLPISIAAAKGYLGCIKAFLKGGVALDARDGVKKTPLMHAVKNGHVDVASYLLKKGANVDAVDSSKNSVCHYAAAYGWLQCLNLLIEAGAALSVANEWVVTPFSIAMLKGHMACANEMLNNDKVDVNLPDDSGRTLISHAAETPCAMSLTQIEFLLSKKAADVNRADKDDNTPLHYLSQFVPKKEEKEVDDSPFSSTPLSGLRSFGRKKICKRKRFVHSDDDDDDDEGSVDSENEDEENEDGEHEDQAMHESSEGITPFTQELHCAVPTQQPSLHLTSLLAQLPSLPQLPSLTPPPFSASPTALTDLSSLLNLSQLQTSSPCATLETASSAIMHPVPIPTLLMPSLSAPSSSAPSSSAPLTEATSSSKSTEPPPDFCVLIASALLKGGAQVNAVNKNGETALSFACQRGNKKLICLLIESGAHVDIAFPEKRNILHQLADMVCEQDVDELVHLVAEKASVSTLLQQVDEEGLTPFLLLLQNVAKLAPSLRPAVTRSLSPEQLKEKMEQEWGKLVKRVKIIFDVYCTPDTINQTVQQLWKYRQPPPIVEGQTPVASATLSPPPPPLPMKEEDKYSANGTYCGLHFVVIHGRTPLTQEIVQWLIAHKINQTAQGIRNKQTPLMCALNSEPKPYTIVHALLDAGAPLFLCDSTGKTPLMVAANMGLLDVVQKMISLCPQDSLVKMLNSQDSDGETALFQLASSLHSQVIQLLLDSGANPNIANKDKIAPLHKLAKKRCTDVAKMLLLAGADPKQTGPRDRTALHYAVNASTPSDTSFYIEELLVKQGADVNALDSLGRTAVHYVFVKAGNHLDGSKMDPIEELANMCTLDGILLDVVDKFGRTPLHYASQRGATICAHTLIQRGADLVRPDEDGNTPLAIGLLSKFPDFSIALLQRGAKPTVPLVAVTGHFVTEKEVKEGSKFPVGEYVKDSKTTHSIFKFVASNDWQGVAYVLLDAGFSLFQAIHDVLRLGKCQQAHTLLRKLKETKDDSIYAKESNQTLYHSLCQSPNVTGWEDTLMEQITEKKIPLDTLDNTGKNALHYAVINHHEKLCRLLLNRNINHDVVDSTGLTPLIYSLSGSRISYIGEISALLLSARCKLNLTFREPLKTHSTTLLIRSLLAGAFSQRPSGEYQGTAKMLLDYGADINQTDDRGMTPLMIVVRKNNMGAVNFLVLSKPKPSMNLQDILGKTVLHHCVNPLRFGSYENVEMLKYLIQHGADPRIPDKAGFTPVHYSNLQGDKRMLRAFSELGIVEEERRKISRTVTSVAFPPIVDYMGDAQKVIDLARSTAVVSSVPEVDDRAKLNVGDAVSVYISPTGDIYDLLMMKVDIKSGAYGVNMFYKMQVLYNSVKDIYILWNRWGRVGDPGQFQNTPFSNCAECIKEFESIFKAKSGNLWSNREHFQKQKGKYNMVLLDHRKFDLRDFMVPFNKPDTYPPSHLPDSICELIKLLSDMSALTQAMKTSGINTHLMPLGMLQKSTLEEAGALLLQLKAVSEEYTSVTQALPLVSEKISEVFQKIVDLSNKFYELIPHGEFKNSPMKPLEKMKDISSKLEMIHSLLNLEVAAKVILGAQANITSMNPFDYCFRALNISIEEVPKTSTEAKLLFKYARNTYSHRDTVKTFFRVRREEEVTRFAPFETCENRLLLWHGSSVSNFIGILVKGLCIAPIEAPSTGYRWGKGIYFADMLEKSVGYCRAHYGSQGLLLLCEVAMGKMAEFYEDKYMTAPPEGFDSTKAVASRGPDFNESVVLPCGVMVPNKPPTEFKPTPPHKYFPNSHCEYIVYDPARVRIRYIALVNC